MIGVDIYHDRCLSECCENYVSFCVGTLFKGEGDGTEIDVPPYAGG